MKTITRNQTNRFSLLNLAHGSVIVLSVTILFCASADAKEKKIPESWKPYMQEQFELKKGYQMYHTDDSIVVLADEERVAKTPGIERLRILKFDMADITPEIFTGIRTGKQAKDLCELLIQGAIVTDMETYQKLLKVHRAAGFDQLVKDGEL
jgi:hypothetical protein